jgi:hypothetical protein
MIRGTCQLAKLLDLVENFTLFVERRGEPAKLVAETFVIVTDRQDRDGRIYANIRAALPNAAFIGFPGTPLTVVRRRRAVSTAVGYLGHSVRTPPQGTPWQRTQFCAQYRRASTFLFEE